MFITSDGTAQSRTSRMALGAREADFQTERSSKLGGVTLGSLGEPDAVTQTRFAGHFQDRDGGAKLLDRTDNEHAAPHLQDLL